MSFGLKSKSNLKIAFAVVALCPFFYGAGPAAAQARSDLKPLTLTQIQDTQENRARFGFAVPVFDDVAKHDFMKADTRVYIGALSDNNVKDIFFQRVEGPIHCGASNCDFSGFIKTSSGFDEVIHIAAGGEIYTQSCPGETSLIFAGAGEQVGKWTYKGGQFELQGTYPSLNQLPVCKAGN